MTWPIPFRLGESTTFGYSQSRKRRRRSIRRCFIVGDVWGAIMQLTGDQTEAINHANGNLQLIACAGSGKTEVVAQHITKLLTPASEGGMGLNPGNVVAFTFTEKAAAELKQRALDRCRERLPGLVG